MEGRHTECACYLTLAGSVTQSFLSLSVRFFGGAVVSMPRLIFSRMNPSGNRDRAQGGHLVQLDGIRGIAILLVLVGHHGIHTYRTAEPFERSVDFGYLGVTLFFVLRGYLITRLLILEENRSGTVSLKRFYARRALRLFPALWLYLLVVAGLTWAGALVGNPWTSFVASLLYIRNIVGQGHETNHLWSLSLEEQFYFVWPVLFCLLPLRNRARLAWAIAGIVVVFAWRTLAERYGLARIDVIFRRSDFRFDSPLFGCGLALVEALYPQSLAILNRTLVRRTVFGLGSVLIWYLWTSFDPSPLRWVEFSLFAALSAVFIGSQLGPSRRSRRRLLSWRPLAGLGTISYGVYLWHQLFFGPTNESLGILRSFPWNILATFVAAGLSYVLLERPLLRLKDRFR